MAMQQVFMPELQSSFYSLERRGVTPGEGGKFRIPRGGPGV